MHNSLEKKFGKLIRELRIQKKIGQRELANKIGLSASYLNDIEKEKRSAPKLSILKKLAIELDKDVNYLNDLAAISKNTIAPDINEIINDNPNIVSLIRSIKKNELTNEEINILENSINKNNAKALIIAAGLGSRLKNIQRICQNVCLILVVKLYSKDNWKPIKNVTLMIFH